MSQLGSSRRVVLVHDKVNWGQEAGMLMPFCLVCTQLVIE